MHSSCWRPWPSGSTIHTGSWIISGKQTDAHFAASRWALAAQGYHQILKTSPAEITAIERMVTIAQRLPNMDEADWRRQLLEARIALAARRYVAAEKAIRQSLNLEETPSSQLLLLEILLQQRQQEDHREVISLTNHLQSLPEWKTPATRLLPPDRDPYD